MKAIVKDTLEIVDVRLANDGWGYYYKGVGPNEGERYNCDELQELEIDWEQRRFELAKAAMAAFISSPSYQFCVNNNYYEASRDRPWSVAEEAVEYADKLICELRTRQIGTKTE